MTATVQPESKSPSRRALLAGALGGLGALAAGAIGRASPVRAEGEAIVVGGEYTDATSPTGISNQTNNENVFWANSNGDGVAVFGTSASATGVVGTATTGTGVFAGSSSGRGMYAYSSSTFQAASSGLSFGNSTGVMGSSGNTPTAKGKTGVFGVADQDANSKGMWGKSPAGHGIHGESSSGWAGYFDGRLFVKKYVELVEISNPSAPSSNHAKLYIRDNGSGKTQLCVRFHNGTIRVIAGA